MMNELFETLNPVQNLFALTLGVFFGIGIANWHNHREDVKDPVHAPHRPDRKQASQKILAGIFLTMAAFVVVQSSAANARAADTAEQAKHIGETQAQCYEEFMRVLSERSALTARGEENIKNYIIGTGNALANPGAFSREAILVLVNDFIAESRRISVEKDQNPYPNPRCE